MHRIKDILHLNIENLLIMLSKVNDMAFLMKVERGDHFLYVHINEKGRTLTGLGDEHIGKPIEEVYPKDFAEYLNDKYKRAVKKDEPYVLKQRVQLPNGLIIEELTLLPIRDDEDKCTYVLALSKDITEKARQEEELLESNQLLHSFLEHTGDAFMMYDLEGHVLKVNKAWEEMFGWRTEEVIGKEMPMIPQFLGEDYRAKLKSIKEERKQGFYRTKRMRKDGSLIDVSTNVTPLKNKEGEVFAGASIIRDITDVTIARNKLKESEERYRLLVELSPEMIVIMVQGNFAFINQAGLSLIKAKDPVELLGKPLIDYLQIKEISNKKIKKTNTLEGTLVRTDSTKVDIEVKQTPFNYQGQESTLMVISDISERKRKEERIKYMALHDGLTGLPNRNYFKEMLNEELNIANSKKEPLAVLFVDLDRFKFVNDIYGHGTGDLLLQYAAHRLKSCVKSDTVISRMGGDEFTFFIRNSTYRRAKKLADHILEAFSKPFDLIDQEIYITTSIGISMFPDNATQAETLLQYADKAMYYAKLAGKNNVKAYTTKMKDSFSKKLKLEKELRKSIQYEDFVLYYQPKVKPKNGEINVEALIRWIHPEWGMVKPTDFITTAEETGLMVPIGEWVIRAACKQGKIWHENGLENIHVAVNLSAEQLKDSQLKDKITTIIKETGFDPRYLELEITESTLMNDPKRIASLLTSIKELGITISIDDFGVSYSSLNYLKLFPIDHVKIDRSFIRDIDKDPKAFRIVESVIDLAHKLDLTVTAEGVETMKQLQYLIGKNCDEIQGFLLSKPIPADQLGLSIKKIRTDILTNEMTK